MKLRSMFVCLRAKRQGDFSSFDGSLKRAWSFTRITCMYVMSAHIQTLIVRKQQITKWTCSDFNEVLIWIQNTCFFKLCPCSFSPFWSPYFSTLHHDSGLKVLSSSWKRWCFLSFLHRPAVSLRRGVNLPSLVSMPHFASLPLITSFPLCAKVF